MMAELNATELRPGAELETKYDEELVVTDVDGDDITVEIDGEYTETYTADEVQTSLEGGVMEVVATATETQTGDDGEVDHGTMEIVGAGPADLADDQLYIRFGNVPDDERSWDNRNNRQEDGVSVYACKRDTVDEDADVAADEGYYLSGTMLQTVFMLMTRDTYLVTGEQVGTGADGEPLLRDVEAVTELRTPEGVGGWIPAEEC